MSSCQSTYACSALEAWLYETDVSQHMFASSIAFRWLGLDVDITSPVGWSVNRMSSSRDVTASTISIMTNKTLNYCKQVACQPQRQDGSATIINVNARVIGRAWRCSIRWKFYHRHDALNKHWQRPAAQGLLETGTWSYTRGALKRHCVVRRIWHPISGLYSVVTFFSIPYGLWAAAACKV